MHHCRTNDRQGGLAGGRVVSSWVTKRGRFWYHPDMSSAPMTQSHSANTGSVKEWFWRGDALKDARSASTPSSVSRERLRRARLAAEFAGRMIDPAELWYDGSALPLAIGLYREAAYWVFLAQSDAGESPTLSDLLATERFSRADLSEADAALVKSVLGEKTFVETADEPAETLRHQALLCRTFVHALIRSELAADRHVTRVLLQRLLRIGAVVAAVVAALMAANSALRRASQGPDLAEGKPWRASSKAFDCNPAEKSCGGVQSSMFFHTVEEDNPWVEIDLGSAKKFARVEVENRSDCCEDRAVPLVIETSNDANEWKEIARTSEPFDEWDATFEPVKARYVRARVEKKTYMHLDRVGVRAR